MLLSSLFRRVAEERMATTDPIPVGIESTHSIANDTDEPTPTILATTPSSHEESSTDPNTHSVAIASCCNYHAQVSIAYIMLENIELELDSLCRELTSMTDKRRIITLKGFTHYMNALHIRHVQLPSSIFGGAIEINIVRECTQEIKDIYTKLADIEKDYPIKYVQYILVRVRSVLARLRLIQEWK